LAGRSTRATRQPPPQPPPRVSCSGRRIPRPPMRTSPRST
jgi:hypothetical protein